MSGNRSRSANFRRRAAEVYVFKRAASFARGNRGRRTHYTARLLVLMRPECVTETGFQALSLKHDQTGGRHLVEHIIGYVMAGSCSKDSL